MSSDDVIICYDSTNAGSIPSNADACMGYCDADFAGVWHDMVKRFPELAKRERIVSIGTRAGTVCRIYDVEPGNPLSAIEAAEQVKAMVGKGVYRPGVYCDGSEMPSVRAALRLLLSRHEYTLILANPNGARPTAEQLRQQDLDGIQYGWSSKGQAPAGTDVSAFLPDFFPPEHSIKHPAPVKKTGRPKVKATDIHLDRKHKPNRKATDIHPKVVAATIAGAITTAVEGVLHSHGIGVHLSPAEASAIATCAAAVAGYVKRSD
jgi:hypothetical protein